MLPDWTPTLAWFLAGICATGGFWYFLSQKNYIATLWTGFAAVCLALLAVTMHVHNSMARPREPQPVVQANPPSDVVHAPAPEPGVPKAHTPEGLDEAQLAAADPSYSPMTMSEYFDAWYRKATTSLQRDELERQMLKRRIVWNGKVKSVETERDGRISVVVEPPDGTYGTAFLDFDQSHRQDLLNLRKDQEIRFTGVISSYVSSPFLSQCRLLRVLK
jgi:hypothetical protein